MRTVALKPKHGQDELFFVQYGFSLKVGEELPVPDEIAEKLLSNPNVVEVKPPAAKPDKKSDAPVKPAPVSPVPSSEVAK